MDRQGGVGRSERFYYLDGLRGVAAICVVILHYQAFLEPIRIPGAYLAVDFFFLMSGFVIARTYDDRLAAGLKASRFFVLRLIRLYPMYILGIAITSAPIVAAIVMGVDLVWTPSGFVRALAPQALMLPAEPIAARANQLFPLNFPAWSLFFELLSNLFYAVCFVWLRGRRLVWAIVLSIPALVAVVLVVGTMDGGATWGTGWAGLARVMFSFLLGALISRTVDRLSFNPGHIPAAALFVVLPLLMLADLHGPARQVFDLVCVMAVFPVALVLAVKAPTPRLTGLMTALGTLSYPVYAIHVPIQSLILGLGVKLAHVDPTRQGLAFGLLLVAGVIGLSWWLGRTYDVAARRALTRLTR